MNEPLSIETYNTLKSELAALDNSYIEVEGISMKPSQCYYFDMNPPHILFNTNCPDTLRQKVNAIFGRYLSERHTHSS